jgi:hypothetical protein
MMLKNYSGHNLSLRDYLNSADASSEEEEEEEQLRTGWSWKTKVGKSIWDPSFPNSTPESLYEWTAE